jgi:hypothetical protein
MSAGSVTSGSVAASASAGKIRTCLCCGMSSESNNPILGLHAPTLFKCMLFRPWKKRDAQGDAIGRFCKLCPMGFSMAGWDKEYKDIIEFAKASEKDISLLNALAAVVDRLIAHINAGTVRFRAGGKKDELVLLRKKIVAVFQQRQKRISSEVVKRKVNCHHGGCVHVCLCLCLCLCL